MSGSHEQQAPAWPDDGMDAWWTNADRFAQAHAARPGLAFESWLDGMHGLGWASLCADKARGGQGQPMAVLCRVLEALAAVNASAAAAVHASAAAHLALNLCELPRERQPLLRDLSVHWLAWPAFHDIDEQLWPAVDAQGYLRGQVDMLLGGGHAQWAVLPAQLRDQGMGLVLVDLRHPAVMRGMAVATLGLQACGIADVEFGGVPCEVVSVQGRALWSALAGRLAMAGVAMHAGLGRAGVRDAMRHATGRHQGGGPLTGWGEVRRLLALMHERLHVMQGLLQAGLASPGGEGDATRARHALLHAGPLSCELASDGLQLMGGTGYGRQAPPAMRLADAHQLKCLMGGAAWRRQQLIHEALKPVGGASPRPRRPGP